MITPCQKIRVLLADDHAILRRGLATLLADEPDMEVVAEAADGQQAVLLAKQVVPDVILMDVTMPRLNGIEATRRITAELPGICVIGLSMHDEADMAAMMRRAGAREYLTKDVSAESLIQAIRQCDSSRGKAS